jgi:hypothetical protein
MFTSGLRTALLLAGSGLYGNGLVSASRIATQMCAELLALIPLHALSAVPGVRSWTEFLTSSSRPQKF